MKTDPSQDERIDRYLRHDEGTLPTDFTARTLVRIGETKCPPSRFTPIRWILPLAACFAAVFFLPEFLNHGEKVTPSHQAAQPTSSPDDVYLDDILLLAEPLDEVAPFPDEQTLDLFAILAESEIQ